MRCAEQFPPCNEAGMVAKIIEKLVGHLALEIFAGIRFQDGADARLIKREFDVWREAIRTQHAVKRICRLLVRTLCRGFPVQIVRILRRNSSARKFSWQHNPRPWR
jgi:hypothetical protein